MVYFFAAKTATFPIGERLRLFFPEVAVTFQQLSRWPHCLIALTLLAVSAQISEGQTSPDMKLIVDDGRYTEEEFSKQIAVSADDTVVLTSDFSRGVRTFDMATGGLISFLEGHSLAGDAFYDPRTELFVTTGDRKIKIWDWRQQRLVKTITQPFHSQFMRSVYVDRKKTYVYAENSRYDFATGRILAGNDQRGWAEHEQNQESIHRYFWNDQYYDFNPATGQMTVYDCLSDKLVKHYTLNAYLPGTHIYFDYENGRLFISYKDGVRIVNLSDGSSDRASFDRHNAFDFEASETSCYGISADNRFLVAGTGEGMGLVVLRKIDPNKGFANNTEEVLRRDLSVGEIHSLHHSNKVVYTAADALHLLDLDTMQVVWSTEDHVASMHDFFLAPDNQNLYIDLGGERVNGRTFPHDYPGIDFDKYFNRVFGVWGLLKPGLCPNDLPAALVPLWERRPRKVRLALHQAMALESFDDALPFPVSPEVDPYDQEHPRIPSPSGRYSVAVKDFGDSSMYEGERLVGRMHDPGVIYVVTFSPDEHYVAIGGSGRWVTAMDLKTGKLLRVYGESYIASITFSFDDKYLFTSSEKNEIMMWNMADGKLVRKFVGANGVTNRTRVTPDGRLLLSIASDGSIRFWEVATGKLLLSSFVVKPATLLTNAGEGTSSSGAKAPGCTPNSDNNWVVVAPDGHFDSSDFEQTRGLHWIMKEEALRSLPLEIFMRDYYEPRLLSKVFEHAKLTPVRPLQNLNRELPMAKIVGIEPSTGRSPGATDSGDVSVTVSVESVRSHVQKDANRNFVESGVFDLRLFRNGQLVAQWPNADSATEAKLGVIDTNSKLEAWRNLHQVQLDPAGKATIIFRNIKLPRSVGQEKVDFTAYAFNRDRVKSLTTSAFEYRPITDAQTKPLARRAYLIVMAVNANQSHWNLEVAVPGADRALSILRQSLKDRFPDVIEIKLYSDLAQDSAQVVSTKARKQNLQRVLDVLAGRPVDAMVRQEIDPLSQLRAATPDDAVVLYVGSHGYVDPAGTFYLIPYDTGVSWGLTEDVLDGCFRADDQSPQCIQSRGFLANSISSFELTGWWNGVDAGEVAMILDSCHSGAVSGKEFRPAPLGDPGLGQLSYDKGMQILASSQPTQTERGTWIKGGDGQTLLVLALETIAAANPKWTLTELMQGTRTELPRIMRQLYPQVGENEIQVPALLDFSGRKRNTAPQGTAPHQGSSF